MLRSGTAFTPLPSTSLSQTKTHPDPHRVILPIISAQLPNISYTVSDTALESRGLILHRTPEGLNLNQLNSVFVAVGFPRRDPDKIQVALEHTDSLIWVESLKTKRPVAFARATGDGVFNAIIWDVVVDPTFQGIGLGKAVMERLLEELLQKGITNIALYSEPRVLGFYRPMGFVADPDGIRGMVYSRKQNKNKNK
ncbi:hypothetical protein BVRB_6g140340 [Beta vulgaris subsp. vulgaris]|uniref:GCN5-related N-acetyltransferase 1, chloroplastic-like n=1 Tax=Beta vulgaris subsp. vulgaris TaxID=3555 RepID=UPI00053F7B0E|nr:GCN5-related N-acetyltransferase 1, chloroplastic-like [Beta vulgaris subsp. vulgaris]KMT08351.1 hypothetical protein BVRB_6g140340 [Beta vulgaris subsp. vulgaris]